MGTRGFKKLNDNVNKFAKDINNLIPAALAAGALLIQNDAKNKAPYLTGTLRRSIHTEKVSNTEVKVGTNVEYASYQEYGTSKMAARPYLRPAFDNNRQKVLDKISEVWGQLTK